MDPVIFSDRVLVLTIVIRAVILTLDRGMFLVLHQYQVLETTRTLCQAELKLLETTYQSTIDHHITQLFI